MRRGEREGLEVEGGEEVKIHTEKKKGLGFIRNKE